MNERIEKLFDQAKVECFKMGSKPATTVGYDELEKFAELIVQECVDICLRNHINNIETISAGECAYDIQEHFGVD
jgi:hypothetical protein